MYSKFEVKEKYWHALLILPKTLNWGKKKYCHASVPGNSPFMMIRYIIVTLGKIEINYLLHKLSYSQNNNFGSTKY